MVVVMMFLIVAKPIASSLAVRSKCGRGITPSSYDDLCLAVQIENDFMFLAMVSKHPFFRVVIVIKHGQDHALHVSGICRGEIGRIDVGKCKSLAIGRDTGLHARLV